MTDQRWSRRADLHGMAVVAVLVSCLLVSSAGRFGPGPLWAWRHPYYASEQDRQDARAVLDAVPPDAAVSAQNHLIPHLSARRHIYELHRPIRTDLVVLDLAQDAWPFARDYPRALSAELLHAGYGVVACQGAALLLEKGADSLPCPILSQESTL